jgi:hypothetical protein
MVSPVHGDYRRCQAEIPPIVLFRFPEPALNAQSLTGSQQPLVRELSAMERSKLSAKRRMD